MGRRAIPRPFINNLHPNLLCTKKTFTQRAIYHHLERSVYMYVLFEKMESKVHLFRVVHLSIHKLDKSDALIQELNFFG